MVVCVDWRFAMVKNGRFSTVSSKLCTLCIMRHDLSDCLKQKHGEDQEVHIIYEDQASNDWKSVFLRIHGELTVGAADRAYNNATKIT